MYGDNPSSDAPYPAWIPIPHLFGLGFGIIVFVGRKCFTESMTGLMP